MFQHLRDKAAKALHDARSIMARADGEQRGMSTEEQTQYDAFMTEFDGTREQIQRAERLAAAEASIASQGPIAGRGQGQVRSGDVLASDEYRDGFWGVMRSGLIPAEFRSLTVGTDTKGGHTVPDEFRRELIQSLELENVMRRLAKTFTTESGVMSIPVVSSHGTADWTAEEANSNETDEVFSQVQLNAYKATRLIRVSDELLNDSAFSLASYIATELGRALGRLEETAFVNGDGSSKPTGVVGGSGLGKTATATNAVTADELMDLQYSLGRAYRQRATWLMHDSTVKAIRKLKTGVSSDNTYLWSPGLSANEPDRLLGNPVVVSNNMPEIATGLKAIVFGDFSYYYIGDRKGVTLQRLGELYARAGQVGFQVNKRTDGKVALAEAFKHLVLA